MRNAILAFLALSCLACSRPQPRAAIIVGSKNFTESVILGELVAQKLEAAGCRVERRLNMGGTFVCDAAIASGAIDVYVEYSGTALTAILKHPAASNARDVNRIITPAYAGRGLRWGPALGFNNTFAMIVRKADAETYHLQKISDLKGVTDRFQPGFGYEFVERPDGWKGLLDKYGLRFPKSPRTMDLGLTYKALASRQIDLIAGNSTDGLIESLGLVALKDDLHYFPPYDAAVVTRKGIDRKCRGASRIINTLAGRIDDATMRRMNFEVDGKKRDPAEVVRQFLH